jgi:hypothetical protein
MAIPVKSKAEVLLSLIKSFNQDSRTGIATHEHSVWYDNFFNPLADQTADLHIIMDFVNKSSSLDELELIVRDPAYQDRLRFALDISFSDVQTLISNTIDYKISNFNEVRKSAIASRGYVRLYFSSGSNVTLGAGIEVQTLSGIKFTTTNSFSNFTPSFDSTESLYYVDSAIQCTEAGQIGNVDTGSIKKLSFGAPNLVKVLNLQRTKFGRDRESDLEVIDRTRASLLSKRTSLLKGFVDTVSGYDGVQDVSVILQGNDLMKRREKNAVDVYLIAEEKIQTKEDKFNSVSARYAWERMDNELSFDTYPTAYSGADKYAYKLLSQPVINISGISYSTSPSGSYSSIGSSYSFVPDTTGVWASSVRGHDHVVLDAGAIPNNVWVKINYTYDRLYKDLHTLFQNYENYLVGADILIKKGKEIPVDVTIHDAKIFSGYIESEVKDVIESDLRIFFTGGTDSNSVVRLMSKLGASLDKSDLLEVILSVAGIDRMDTDLFDVKINGVSMGATTSVPLDSYMRLNSVAFINNSIVISEINSVQS